jgi:hypothetical protein
MLAFMREPVPPAKTTKPTSAMSMASSSSFSLEEEEAAAKRRVVDIGTIAAPTDLDEILLVLPSGSTENETARGSEEHPNHASKEIQESVDDIIIPCIVFVGERIEVLVVRITNSQWFQQQQQ